MASAITISLKGVENIQKHFSKIENTAKLKKAIASSTSMVLSTAKYLVQSVGETGALRASLHQTVEQNGNQIVGKVFAGGGHAMFVEFGTGVVGQGSNYPRAAALGLKYAQYSWTYTPDGGETFYTTKGYRARPFMYPALKQNKLRIKRLIEDALREDIK